MSERPSPEKLLLRAQEEERSEQRGKLKIYLGAAPGVGKTFAMLKDALDKRAQGLDIVVGVVESHGRHEIDALLKNLEILPRLSVEYRGSHLFEFDLKAALKRTPGLILIDEMAHTNAPGLMHNKRWQDIKEILSRGIDVYTTLNVQHVESISDVASQIIHAHITETVPDYMLEIADTIELIDLPPEDLLKRLQEGKVYIPKQAELAQERFFRKGNLSALRELALRVTATQVNAQVLHYRQGFGIKHIWPTKEKILVCVGHRLESARHIRAAKRLATLLQADWIAIHIDATRIKISDEQHNIAIQNLRLAEQLGAETRIINGTNIVKEIMSFSHEQNITKIVIGKRIRPRWQEFLFKSLTDELIRASGEIDVYIITGDHYKDTRSHAGALPKRVIPWKIFAAAFGIVGICTLLNVILLPYVLINNVVLVYLLGVTIVALFGEVGPSIFASILSVMAYGFFFSPSIYTFDISNLQFIFTLLVMLFIAVAVSHLTILSRRQAEAARKAEQRTSTLHTLSRKLASTRGIDNLLITAAQYLGEMYDSEVIALLAEDQKLTLRARFRTDRTLKEKEQAVVQWVYDMGQVAGLGTDTLPSSNALYVPLLTSHGTIGVLSVQPLNAKHLFSPEQTHLLEACANQIALAIEADRSEQVKKSELQSELVQLAELINTLVQVAYIKAGLNPKKTN